MAAYILKYLKAAGIRDPIEMTISPNQTDTLVQKLFEGHDAKVYAILDGASVINLVHTLEQYQAEFECLYRGELDPELQQVAPYLVALPKNSALAHWVVEGMGRNWGIFAVSAANIRGMRKHFRTFLMVYDSDNQPIYFRYYDPRVLRDFLSVCTAEQKQILFGPVLHYFVEGEKEGQLLGFSPDNPEKTKVSQPDHFIISKNQMELLTRSSFMERTRQFLMQRCRNDSIRSILQHPETWKPLWAKLLAEFSATTSEHDCAVQLSFALACLCEKLDPLQEIERLQQQVEKTEYQMKSFLAKQGYLRFSEFDLDSPGYSST